MTGKYYLAGKINQYGGKYNCIETSVTKRLKYPVTFYSGHVRTNYSLVTSVVSTDIRAVSPYKDVLYPSKLLIESCYHNNVILE